MCIESQESYTRYVLERAVQSLNLREKRFIMPTLIVLGFMAIVVACLAIWAILYQGQELEFSEILTVILC